MYCLLRPFLHTSFKFMSKIKVKYVCVAVAFIMLLDFFGIFTHMFEVPFDENFIYPYDGDVQQFVTQIRHNEKPDIDPINEYNYSFIYDIRDKCVETEYRTLRVVYLVKSALEHFDRRLTIRNSWGYEKRFSDVPSRTIFLLGVHPGDNKIQAKVKLEAEKYNDIVQAEFVDSYYNNTIKTMIGFKWSVKYCANSKFYMFVDDDMYVSVKNVLRFIRNPAYYPDYLKEPDKLRKYKREIKKSDISDTLDEPKLIKNTREKKTILNLTNFSLANHQKRVTTKDKISSRYKSEWTYDNMTQFLANEAKKSTKNQINVLKSINKTSILAAMQPSKLQTSEYTNSVDTDNQKNMERRAMEHELEWTLFEKIKPLIINTQQNVESIDKSNSETLIKTKVKRQVFDFELPDDVRLFTGFVFVSSPHRHKTSKWYVSLQEYPYHLWPPYVTGGAYILSKEALLDMYYTSLYTKHFRFDDIFLAFVAKKADIEPLHCEEFHFYKKDYTRFNYKYVISSHGYRDRDELLKVWNEQKALGNA